MADDPHFVIQGVDYPVPTWDTFTLDESEILYDRAKLTLADIDEDLKMSPGLISALLVVAYLRGNPNAPRARAERIVGAMKMTDVLDQMIPDGDADVPPSQPPTPDEPESEPASTPSSGDDSGNDSENSAGPPDPTGTSGSDTLPTLAPARLAS